MGLNNNPHQASNTIFATVLADGKIHVNVKEGTEGAVKREYETSDGKTGFKWEHQYTDVTGIIQGVFFKEGDFGENLNIVIGSDEDDKPITLSLSTESNYGEDAMKKLPNINLKKPVNIAPFSFENDKGKKQRGLTITQESKNGEKVKIVSYFYDTRKKTTTNGYPKAPAGGAKTTKKDWRKYFDGAREFLIEYNKEHVVFGAPEAKDDNF